ncbi:MAG: AEC family transporter [Rhodobacteraceae bacterium]|nr:AEC family transporter [Paracoccaceae bacterium]
MQALADVILPVFLVLGFGYLAAWRGWIEDAHIDGLAKFTQGFAIPCLLFSAIANLDLSASLQPRLLGAFYAGALTGFALGLAGARLIFARPWPDAVAIGFVAMFSNSIMLGVPITERAYGADALAANFVIVAFHAPFCYIAGITAMEIARASGAGLLGTARTIVNAVFRNSLVIGILAGFAVNVSGLPIPGVVQDALDLMIRAAIPAALFGLGGVLYRYRPEGDVATIAMVVAISLLVHPAVTFGLGKWLGLTTAEMRSAVLTAAMAPGVNAYLFANMYGVARRVAASAVLAGTASCLVSAWIWLQVLP